MYLKFALFILWEDTSSVVKVYFKNKLYYFYYFKLFLEVNPILNFISKYSACASGFQTFIPKFIVLD